MAICKNCGTEVPEGTEYCPTCGIRVAGEGWRDRRQGWSGKDWRNGAWWNEGWRDNWNWAWSPLWIMINALIIGLGIVFVGTLLFLVSSGVMSLVSWDNFWAYLLIGLGLLGVIRESAKIYVSKRMHWPGGIIFAIVLVLLGAAGLVAQCTGWSQYWWTFVIAAAGLIIILIGLFNYIWMRGLFRK